MQNIPVLLPTPRKLILTEGLCIFHNKNLIHLDADHPQTIIFTAQRVQAAIDLNYHLKLEIYAGKVTQLDHGLITLRLDQQLNIKPQGYWLKIFPDGISIEARDEPGLFYACCTLTQLLQYYTFESRIHNLVAIGGLPCMEIHDWPDFPNRGVMLDVSRDKVPTMETIFNLVDLLASWKINQLQLYTEHTFAYQQHPEVWSGTSPLTGEEILKVDAYCRDRYIELVPNQNSFGHMEHWLKLPRYKPLAEAPDGCDLPSGRQNDPFSLCPLDPASIALIRSLYDELLPHFSSRQFNVGCDETFDLGYGRSKAECERVGTGRVYLDFLLKIYREVIKRGFRMQFWGDIIMAYPELVKELPGDVIGLEWGYEANHPFRDHGEKFAQIGLSFYVCPGTSAWNSIAGRTDNCLANLANAAQNGTRNGADGYLITDWGDNGHWQVMPVSYLGYAAGAAFAWSFQANKDLDIRDALNQYAFLDPMGTMGKLAFDLGNIYHEVGIEPENASALFYILQNPICAWKDYLKPESAIQIFQHTLNVIDQVSEKPLKFSSMRSDNDLLQLEFMLTLHLLQHACMRGIYGFGSSKYSRNYLSDDLEKIIIEYQQVWLSRNRPGGLSDSLAYFQIAKKEYQAY